MKDSAALLHISLHRENNLYGRLLGDIGKGLKEKNFLKLYMKAQTVVGHGFFGHPEYTTHSCNFLITKESCSYFF